MEPTSELLPHLSSVHTEIRGMQSEGCVLLPFPWPDIPMSWGPPAPMAVYGLRDPAMPDVIRYVGRTRDTRNRIKAHRRRTATTPAVGRWVDGVAQLGRQVEMVGLYALEEFTRELGNVPLRVWEAAWIHRLKSLGQADLNILAPTWTFGGNGTLYVCWERL